jgi:hypothetical protein
MPNLVRNGFRWVQNRNAPSTTEPPIMILPVASAFAVTLTRGYPVKVIADGTIEDADPGDAIYGIFDGAAQYYDGSTIRKGGSLPVSTYGSVIQRQSLARVIPVRGQLFRATVDDATTATTLAAYLAFVQENVEWVAGTAVGDEAGCQLDISGHNTTNTLSVRIENVPDRELQDFGSAGVSLLVSFNLIQDTASGSTTGT